MSDKDRAVPASAPSESPRASDRPVRRRARETRERIETAALSAFAELGFEGASTGAIARRAGVTQQLVIYHYGTKLALWQAVADGLFERLGRRIRERVDGLEGVDDGTRFRLLVREFVHFSAEVPELARFVFHEGHRNGPRLTWMIERHIRPQFDLVVGALERGQALGLVASGDPVHLFFLLLGSAAMLAQPAQAQLLTGRDLSKGDELDAYADLVVRAISAQDAGENG
ncbi:MAG: TetR/AcrR family transcriptional regulator [Myxococcota bacterium]